MSFIISLIVGGIIGWLASIIMKTNAQMGLIANILVCAVGSLLGSFVGGLIGLGGGAVVRFIFGVLGAVLLIFVLRTLGIYKKEV